MRRAAVLLVMLLAAMLAACGREAPKFQLTDLTGADFGRELRLTDHTGKPRTLADFKGKVVVIFFGFTHCPDVCPTALAELANAAKELGKDAGRMQVLFVTVDPERDTPAVLASYVPAFDPGFLGLTGDADAIARTAKEFKVFACCCRRPDGARARSLSHLSATNSYCKTASRKHGEQTRKMTPALDEHAISELNRVALPRLRFDNAAVLFLAACRNPKSDRLLGSWCLIAPFGLWCIRAPRIVAQATGLQPCGFLQARAPALPMCAQFRGRVITMAPLSLNQDDRRGA